MWPFQKQEPSSTSTRLKFISMSLEKMAIGSLKEYKREDDHDGHGLGRAQELKGTWDH